MCGEPGGALEAPPILEKINQKLPPIADQSEAVARRHNCNGVWCNKGCYKRLHLARHHKRLLEMPMEESRLVTLTLDRRITGEGADAYLFIREKKALGRFFVSLKRQGVFIRDWAGQMEFHKDGSPHYHLVIRTRSGRKGMIGNEALLKAWPWGGVREDYFKSKAHYDNTVGYFGKSGYFHKGKKYQTELPDYFKSPYFQGKRIMRFYSARRSQEETPEQEKNPDPQKSVTITALKLKTCGQFTHIWAYYDDRDGLFPQSETHFLMTVNIPYKEFLEKHPGYYRDCVGYCFYLSGVPPEEEPCPF